MRESKGQLVWDQRMFRIRVGGGKRVRFKLACATEAEAGERTDLVVEWIHRLRAARREDVACALASRGAAATSATELAGIRLAVDLICAGRVVARPKFESTITFERFATQWTSGQLHDLFPNRIKRKKSAYQDAKDLGKWVYPRLGKKPISEISYDDCEDVLDAIPESRSVYVVRHVAQAMARVMRLAVHPARVLKQSPIPAGFVPPILKRRAFTYLFPTEDRLLLGSMTIPLAKRLLYGLLDREGLRLSEALSLDVSDLGLDVGSLTLDQNKTNDPRCWALREDVAEALRLWVNYFHPSPVPNARVFSFPADASCAARPLKNRGAIRPDDFRTHLHQVGCVRPQLFEDNEDRRQIRIHDLRATFVTNSLAIGKSEAWIGARTGHRSSHMIFTYRRHAACHAELNLGPLDSLVDAIPELRALRSSAMSCRQVRARDAVT